MSRTWTDEQRALLETGPDGWPLLKRVAVSADAGAGKTSVLVERVRGLPEEKRILCVSFTEKSKADLEDRLSDKLTAEVYTIHGFCLRVVSEFGGRVGLSPVFRILSQDESDDLFYQCFEKVYRRSPPANLDHRVETFLKICERAREFGENVEVIDCSRGDTDLSTFVAEVLAEYETTKRTARVLEYGDLERQAACLLKNSEVAGSLQQRYSHVFVDEFQDTSRVQCDLVEGLVGTKIPLFVVGDVKQSIYRFRGADVRVFEQFVATLPERKRLSANFRSHVEVIDAVNTVCAPVIHNYAPMRACRVEKEAREVWTKLPRVARVTAECDADAVEAILRRLRAEGVDWSDVVLLTRRMRGNEELFAELGKRGIAVAATSSASSGMDDRLGTLLNLWVWACEPWQRLRAAQVAVDFPWAFEVESAQVARERLDELLSRMTSPYGAGEALSCEDLLSRLERVFGLHARMGAVYEQFKIFVLRHQSEGLSASALARRLDRLLLNEEKVDGFALLPPPSNLSGTVRALTVHSSKGLEFPVVLLLDVGPRRAPSRSFFARGERIWLPGRTDKGELDWSGEELEEARTLEAEDELAESARLLYVAMTRAQEALYVLDRPDPVEDEAKPSKPKKSTPSWALWLKRGIDKTLPAEVFAANCTARMETRSSMSSSETAAPVLSSEPAQYGRARVGVSELAGKIAANEAPSAKSEVSASGPRAKIVSGTKWDARQIGTHIHKCLEHEDWGALRASAKELGLDLSMFWAWLETDVGKRVFGGAKRVQNEFAFEWNSQGQGTVTGRIDRLNVMDDALWVIDYKVLLGRRDKDDLLETYGPQLRIYTEAVKYLTGEPKVEAFILDIGAATGEVWLPVLT